MRETPEQWLWLHRRWKTPAPRPRRTSRSASGPPPSSRSACSGVQPRRCCSPEDAVSDPAACVRAPNWVGDVVLSLPARARPAPQLPGVAPRGAGAAVGGGALRAPCPRWTRSREPRHARRRRGAARALRRRACCCRTRSRSALALWRAGIPERWGYATDGRGAAADARARACRASVRGRSQVYYYRAMLAGVGLARVGAARRLARLPGSVGGARARAARRARALDRPQPRRRLRHRQALAARALRRRRRALWRAAAARRSRSSARPPSGRSAEAIAARCGARARPVRRDDAPRAGRRAARLRLLVTNDSGPMHVAAALGTPLVAVFGPTDWRETAPVSERARARARAGPLLALPAARVPDRPPLHDAGRGRPRRRRRALELLAA